MPVNTSEKQMLLENSIRAIMLELTNDLKDFNFEYSVEEYDKISNCFKISMNTLGLKRSEVDRPNFDRITFYLYPSSLMNTIAISINNISKVDEDFKNYLIVINEANSTSINGFYYIQNNWIRYNSTLKIKNIENSISKDDLFSEIALLVISLDRIYLMLAKKINNE